MKTKDLRIGNLVSLSGDLTLTIIEINSVYFYAKDKKGENFKSSWADINPIPLTEDWLLKFGAKARFEHTEFIYSRFRLIWKEPYKYWYVIDSDSLSYLTKIDFVHEWQNFISILTGEELTYEN